MKLKVLGISGSPVKEGNLENFMNYMLETASKKGLHTEAVYLSEKKIHSCQHCNFCIENQTADKYCSIDDDAQEIFDKIIASDIILLASPVYFMRSSSLMAALIDRLRAFLFGNVIRKKLKNKIGVSAAVSWMRNAGLETTHLSHICTFLSMGMIPASVHTGISPLGASGLSSPNGSGEFDENIRLGVMNDEHGLSSASILMSRAIELAELVKKGTSS
jgi:multimeric flavodoxin WrbA